MMVICRWSHFWVLIKNEFCVYSVLGITLGQIMGSEYSYMFKVKEWSLIQLKSHSWPKYNKKKKTAVAFGSWGKQKILFIGQKMHTINQKFWLKYFFSFEFLIKIFLLFYRLLPLVMNDSVVQKHYSNHLS